MFALLLALLHIFPVLAFSAAVTSLAALPDRVSALVALFLFAFADIVFAAYVLSVFDALGSGGFLVLHWLCAAIAVFWWRVKSGYRLAAPARAWRSWFRTLPADLRFLLGAVTVSYLVALGLTFVVAPNNWDAMTYHLSRAVYWLQGESLAYRETHNLRQVVFPPNAELGLLWAMLFSGGDRWCGLVQWLAAITGGLLVFGTARLLTYDPAASLFAALVWLGLPQVLLQSTSTQNDLVATAFCLATVYFLLLGIREKYCPSILLSGLSVGLAAGTKLTALLHLPGLAVGAILMPLAGRGKTSTLVTWGAACAVSFLCLGSHRYVSNLALYGAPLGDPAYVRHVSNQGGIDKAIFTANMTRHVYALIDFTGLPPEVSRELQSWKAGWAPAVFRALHVDPNPPSEKTMYPPFRFDSEPRVHEDLAWFGPLGFLLLVPSLIVGTAVGIVRRDPSRLVLAASCASFFVAASAALAWNPWTGRHFLIFAALGAPFMAGACRRSWLWLVVRWLTTLTSILVMAHVLIANEAKPLIGMRAAWSLDRIGQQSLTRAGIEPLLRLVDAEVPGRASIVLIAGGDDWDYPLFGPRLSRHVVSIHPPPSRIDEKWLSAQDADFLLTRTDLWVDVSEVPNLGHPHWDLGTWCLVDLRATD